MSTITLLKNDLAQMKALRFLVGLEIERSGLGQNTSRMLDERIASVEKDLTLYAVPDGANPHRKDAL